MLRLFEGRSGPLSVGTGVVYDRWLVLDAPGLPCGWRGSIRKRIESAFGVAPAGPSIPGSTALRRAFPWALWRIVSHGVTRCRTVHLSAFGPSFSASDRGPLHSPPLSPRR